MLFTLYLAKALKEDIGDHNYAKHGTHEDTIPPIMAEHAYSLPSHHQPILIDQQYADDIGWITTAKYTTNLIKDRVPLKLKGRGLEINDTKTEEYDITRGGSEEWKKCKYVGSLIDTKEDIKRRKKLAMASYTQYRSILTSTKIDVKTRIRLFDAYISSVSLYNSEVWSLTKTLENAIDVSQRNLLRENTANQLAIHSKQRCLVRTHSSNTME